MLEITKILRVTPSDTTDSPVKAFVDVEFNGLLVVRGMKIILGQYGLFVGSPNRKAPDGSYRDIVYFNSAACEQKLDKELKGQMVKAYEEHLANAGAPAPAQPLADTAPAPAGASEPV